MSMEEALDTAVARAIAERRIVGAVLLVRQGGKTVYEKAHGLADREAGRAMEADAIFRLASLTKPIIAATILAMRDQGLVALEAPVTDHLPDFRPALADGTRPTITLEHLLTHSSGLSTPTARPGEPDAMRNSADAILERIAAEPLQFAPGTRWSYGISIDVLGALAGKLVGGSPEDAARRFVLDPLDMSDTRFSVTDRSRLAAPYGDSPAGAERMGDVHTVTAPWGGSVTFHPTRIFDPEVFQSGGGGMAGTGQDFMTLLEAFRIDGAGIMRPETARAAFANRLAGGVASGPGWGFGHIGAVLLDPAAAKHPAGPGTVRWGGIYGHNWFIDPARDLTMVSMSNTGLEGSDGAYRDEIAHAVYSSL